MEQIAILKSMFIRVEEVFWELLCRYNHWIHGPYGLAMTVEKLPFRFIIKFLRKYGATIGKDCHIERGINLHRPFGKKPFENLILGSKVYLGHNCLIDLTKKVKIMDKAIIASRCQIWTHASHYRNNTIENSKYYERDGDVTIKPGAIVYSNVIITHGITIGKFSKIRANSLITRDVSDYTSSSRGC